VPAPAPIAPEKDWRPEFYSVKRGDTLYQIALEHGLDYRELAAINNMENINVIRVGQVLRLRPPTDPTMAGPQSLPASVAQSEPKPELKPAAEARPVGRGNTDTYKSGPKAVKLPFSDAALAQLMAGAPKQEAPVSAQSPSPPAPATVPPPSAAPSIALVTPSPSAPPAPPPPAAPSAPPIIAAPPASSVDSSDDRVDWGWPARGRIINGYSESASLKGIDIGGPAGASIVSSAPGKVVYAGSGLRGYGKLVIVKHNKTYLSAYAHLDQILVKEGQMVGKGQELGKMGNTDADQVKLHFEIRSLGKPVDPMRYLPRG
jgi:lipoprotein NlpD